MLNGMSPWRNNHLVQLPVVLRVPELPDEMGPRGAVWPQRGILAIDAVATPQPFGCRHEHIPYGCRWVEGTVREVAVGRHDVAGRMSRHQRYSATLVGVEHHRPGRRDPLDVRADLADTLAFIGLPGSGRG